MNDKTSKDTSMMFQNHNRVAIQGAEMIARTENQSLDMASFSNSIEDFYRGHKVSAQPTPPYFGGNSPSNTA